jgi:hypothetical protein
MLKYIISTCFVFITFIVVGQETEEPKKVNNNEVVAKTETTNETLPFKKKYGLRVGIDISKPILSLMKNNFTGFEIVGDYRIKRDLYIAAEIGAAEQDTRRDTYQFTTKGSYIAAGINYNFFKNWLEMDNEIYMGMRYGFSSFSQTVNYYTVFQKGTEINGTSDSYFEPKKVEIPRDYNDLTAHWIAIVFGMKVETLKNLYLGFSVQINSLLTSTQPQGFENLNIPGFNKVYSTGNGIGFNYTLSYRIPLYKK